MSTLIGCIFAAHFRQLPGQKRSLYDFCTHPRPEIDLTFSVEGATYRALRKIDPKARQMESYLFDGHGTALANGKKEAFQAVIRKRVGSEELFLASYFSSQKRTGNFLGLDRSERKQLFITQLLGLDRLRLIAGAARDGRRSGTGVFSVSKVSEKASTSCWPGPPRSKIPRHSRRSSKRSRLSLRKSSRSAARRRGP